MHTYHPEEDFFDECYGCENKRNVIYEATEYLDEVVKRLYISDQTDIVKLQIALDKLCDCLGVKTIEGEINIEKRKPDLLEEWMIFNENYLRSLAKTQIAIGE